MKRLSELLQHLSYLSQHHSVDWVENLHYDSRKVGPHSLFVARKSATLDGHDFIDKAIAAGATTIVCEKLPNELLSDRCYLLVENANLALAQLSHAFYDFPSQSLRMIAVSGTNGKTTCSFVLKQILESIGLRVGLIGTTGNYIANVWEEAQFTTPESPELCALLQRMKHSEVHTVIMEVSSHALELNRVAGIRYDAALFTNLTQDHLDFHGTMEAYLRAKKRLFDGLDENAFAVVNADDEASSSLLKDCQARIVGVGRSAQSPVFHCQRFYRISNEALSSTESSFQMLDRTWHTSLVGSFNVDNLALCLSACHELGMSIDSLQDSLPHIRGAAGRMERLLLSNGVVAIVDYAHSPDALEKALVNLKKSAGTSTLVCVFGAGGDRDRTKRPIMGAVAEKYADRVIITNDNPRSESPENIAQDILRGMQHPEHVLIVYDRREAIAKALADAKAGDIVLIAGKGHENYQIVGTERRHFSDVETVLNISGGEAHA